MSSPWLVTLKALRSLVTSPEPPLMMSSPLPPRKQREAEEQERARRREEKLRRREQRQRAREQRRSRRRVERLQAEEQRRLRERVRAEERRLLLAQRNLQSIRLVAELLSRAEVGGATGRGFRPGLGPGRRGFWLISSHFLVKYQHFRFRWAGLWSVLLTDKGTDRVLGFTVEPEWLPVKIDGLLLKF